MLLGQNGFMAVISIRWTICPFFVLFSLLSAVRGGAFPETAASSLRLESTAVEGQVNPIGVDTSNPRFGWTLAARDPAARGLTQTAYRILLATSRQGLQSAKTAAWDTGKVLSSQTNGIVYAGTPLQSHRRYYWRVQVWDQDGRPSAWSDPATLVTGILSRQEWRAQWIAAALDSTPEPQGREYISNWKDKTGGMPLFRRDFQLRKPVASAVLVVSGLGQYELRVNGDDVTDTVLNPGWTNYRQSVAYNTYDVTSLVHPGSNALGILVGNGMYNVEGQRGRYTKFTASFGQPKIILELHLRYRDGSEGIVLSDGSWSTHPGPIVYSSTYGGEDFDARLEPKGWALPGFAGTGWSPVSVVQGPGGELRSQQPPYLRIMHRYDPVSVTEPRPGVLVYDLGQNMSGWPEIRVSGDAGEKVRLVAGELLDREGLVTQHSANAGPGFENSFSYTLRGGGAETWHPRFSYWGFRYVQVEGALSPSARVAGTNASVPAGKPVLQALIGDFVHDDLRVVGQLSSSDELIGRIHTLIDMAILSNSFSVLTDCPHREKLGWLEQTYLNGSSLFFNYDYGPLYEKLARDMEEAQLPDGMEPGIAPEYVAFVRPNGESTMFRDSPEWGSASILSPWTAFTFTGDMRPLSAAYPMMKKYAGYLHSKAEGGLLGFGLGDWYDIGPGNPGVSQLTSKEVTATATFYEDLTVLARVAGLLNKPEEAKQFAADAEAIKRDFNARIFHGDTNQYDRGSQTANAMALVAGLVPDGRERAVLENLIADIRKHNNHVTAGDVGFHYVVRALTDAGRSDVMRDLLSRTDSPSYGYQLARGATTLTEAWDTNPNSSQNHFMLGHGEEWFYRGLAGIRVDMSLAPADRIQICPQPVQGVSRASASYDSALGKIRSSWSRSGLEFDLEVTIPPNARAHVEVPASMPGAVTIDGKPLREFAVGECSSGPHSVTCSVPSGLYHFSSSW
jgi:hypothetical protein